MTQHLRLSSRITAIKPSVTLAVTARAAKLKAEGIDVVGFGAGEPDFDTPAHIKDAAKRALDAGETKYTDVRGTAALRKAICRDLERAHRLKFEPDQIIVSCGAKHSLYNLFQALLDEGDEVIVPAPYWVSYPELVRLAGGTPVIVNTRSSDGFTLRPEDLHAAITHKTRALILCSPSNPTGGVYTRAQLEALEKVVLERDLLVVSDDIYRHLIYGDAVFHEFATLSKEAAARTLLVDGFSKSYAMTGWRLGFTAAPKPVVDAMATVQGQSTSNPTSIAMAAAVAALDGPQDCVETMRLEFDRRRRTMVDKLRAIPGVTCFEPKGAFYAFPDLSAYVGKRPKGGAPIEDDVGLCDYLLDVGRVAIVPGSGFGAPGYVRLSYATSMDNVVKGIGRLGEALASLVE